MESADTLFRVFALSGVAVCPVGAVLLYRRPKNHPPISVPESATGNPYANIDLFRAYGLSRFGRQMASAPQIALRGGQNTEKL